MNIIDILEQLSLDLECSIGNLVKRSSTDKVFIERIANAIRKTKEQIRRKDVTFDSRSDYSVVIDQFSILRKSFNDCLYSYNIKGNIRLIISDVRHIITVLILNTHAEGHLVSLIYDKEIEKYDNGKFIVDCLKNTLSEINEIYNNNKSPISYYN